ncbi:hypothetical protein DCS_08210 [Drechmeria coniospora]|uniref:Uncharacterized protein n=1 Tax=Drechmeria coniospora TaxID=98403 RepID=A0A151GGK9_DRECN|nr:hypothetical protein DCS_08210 [Drechmeria coniospora]KYK56240.1 hypothetical protein DCS_08210 [Drechmeria coniospora]ODA80555.1 hypothetical protein RJ55_03514 [Drechmeria coniospora]
MALASTTIMTVVPVAAPTMSALQCSNKLFQMPIRDSACAMPYSDRGVNIMSNCCKDASVVSYYDKCGLYCLAQGQNVGSLTDCFYREGASYQDVFCSGGRSDVARGTGTGTIVEPNAFPVVVPKTGPAASQLSASPSASPSSANTRMQGPAGAVGVAIGAILLSAFAVGTLQI